MPSVQPSTSSFPFPGQHADDPNGAGPHGNGAANGGNPSHGMPDANGRTGDRGDSDVAEDRGQLGGDGGGDGDGTSGPGRSGRGGHGDGNGNGVGNGNGNGNGVGNGNGIGNGGPDNTGTGQQAMPGQSYPGMPGADGRTGGLGGNGYAYGNGNGGANHGGGVYAGGAQTPSQGGLGGLIGQVSQAAASITSAVFGSVANTVPNSAPNLFTEHLPRFVGDSATQTQPSNDHGAPPQPSPPSPQRASNDATALPPRNADPTPQPAANPAAGAPEAEGRGLLAQPGIDARTAQMLAQGGAPLAQREAAPESAPMAGMLAPTAMEAEALERALTDGQNKAQPQRTDGKDMLAQLRQAAGPEGEANVPQQTAQSRQQTDALDRMLAKMQPDARTALDARAADGRPLDARTADGRLVPTDGRLVQADGTQRSTTDTATSRQATDVAKTATGTTEGGRLPVGADGKSAQSSFGRGLFGGAAEYTRQALDWVGQQVREFGFGASPDADGARAMRVVAGLVVASVGVLVVIGVLYALRIIFVA